MKHMETMPRSKTKAREIAEQLEIELAILLRIEETLRIALQWMTRDRGNSHKLSTLRFHTASFERHLSRIGVLVDYGGYLHLITDSNPHLLGEVDMLRNHRAEQQANLMSIIARLEYASGDDMSDFEQICLDLAKLLDALTKHSQRESELLQHSYTQVEGGSG